MNWEFIIKYLPMYERAALLTVKLGLAGVICAIIVGLICAIIQYEKVPVARQIVAAVSYTHLDVYKRQTEDTMVALCSAPGRTEICGNHTDHQHGRVLAAAVNLDFLACVALNGTSVVHFQSEGWPMTSVDLADLEVKEEEKETTASLIRGRCV